MPSNAYYSTYTPPSQPDLNLSPHVVLSCVFAGLILIYHTLGTVVLLPSPGDFILYMASRLFGPGARETLQANFTARNSAFSLRNRAATLRGTGSGEGVVGGLWNTGNTCYQNSVLQALASLPALTPYLVAIDEGNTANALQDLVDSLNSVEIGARAETPVTAITKADGKGWGYNEQQDAQEYLQGLMAALEKEYARVQKRRKEEKRVGLEGILLPARNGPEIVDEEDVPSPFEGLLAQRVGCLSCGYVEAIGMQPFTTLSLPIPRTITGDSTIEACLREFVALERITQVDCDKCTLLSYEQDLNKILARENITDQIQQTVSKRLDAVHDALETDNFSAKIPGCKKTKVSATKTKQVMISRAPKILALHTNRSVFDMRTGMIAKNYAAIAFPMKLNLGRIGVITTHESIVTDPARNMSPAIADGPEYELRSVVAHYGAHHNGHYITYRFWAGKWWKISDHEVYVSSEEEVLAAGNAFMLFYEHVSDTKTEKTEKERVINTIKAAPPVPLAKGLMTPPPEFIDEIDGTSDGRSAEETLPTPASSDSEEDESKIFTPNRVMEKQLATPPPDDLPVQDTASPAVAPPTVATGKARKRKGKRKQEPQQTQTPVAVQ